VRDIGLPAASALHGLGTAKFTQVRFAARAAHELTELGWKNVHPLYGGFDAWVEAGLPLDQK
jgi:3-mercaptopyruvate sulfurtransferase SseA